MIRYFIVPGLLFLAGCVEQANGPTLTEKAEVADTCFVPKGHGSDLAVGYSMGKGGGLTFTPVDVDISARYAIVFKCQHGKFVIDGPRGEEMYKRLDKGDKVVISYCEKLAIEDTHTNVCGLHFLNAQKEVAK